MACLLIGALLQRRDLATSFSKAQAVPDERLRERYVTCAHARGIMMCAACANSQFSSRGASSLLLEGPGSLHLDVSISHLDGLSVVAQRLRIGSEGIKSLLTSSTQSIARYRRAILAA